jgi:uncharacterized protein YajQ (UPF0234 family)
MIVTIPYRFIEEHAWCEKDFGEYLPYADDAKYEFTVDDCEFEYSDLKDIVEAYTDDIIDILLDDEQLRNVLLKKLRSRKIDVSVIDAKDEKNAKR